MPCGAPPPRTSTRHPICRPLRRRAEEPGGACLWLQLRASLCSARCSCSPPLPPSEWGYGSPAPHGGGLWGQAFGLSTELC